MDRANNIPPRCRYRGTRCQQSCDRKDSGDYHSLCAYHREKGIECQRNYELRKKWQKLGLLEPYNNPQTISRRDIQDVLEVFQVCQYNTSNSQ